MRTSDADTLSRFLDAERNSRYRVAFPFLATTVRRELDWARSTGRQADERARPGTPDALIGLTERRRKLLELHYAGRISAELFAEEEGRLTRQINALWMESHAAAQEADELDDLEQRFQEVLELLQDLDLERVWAEASQQERRVLIDELVDRVAVYPDHLEVTVHGVPTLNVLLSEVGLRESENARVGGGT